MSITGAYSTKVKYQTLGNLFCFATTSCRRPSVQKSGGPWSCAAFVLFWFFSCWLALSKLFFALPEARGQHTSATVYGACWLRARRVSGAWAPLSLRRPDDPFIATGCEALTPSQILKRHSQCRSKGSSWSRAELDQIPQQPLRWALSLHSSVIYDPSMGKYHLASTDISHLWALAGEFKTLSKNSISSLLAKLLLINMLDLKLGTYFTRK